MESLAAGLITRYFLLASLAKSFIIWIHTQHNQPLTWIGDEQLHQFIYMLRQPEVCHVSGGIQSCLDEEQSPEKEDVVLIEENGQESNGINGNFDIAWPVNEPETSQIMAKPVETYLADEVSNNLDQTNSKAPTDEEEFNDESFHCRDLLHMNFDSLDPSLALGFICKLEDDFNDLVEQLKVGLDAPL